jgi:hypothetical protein
MSQSQGIEVQRPSRRTIAKGAAWAVPVIAIGASAPAFAASGGICIPEFAVQPGSFKCCNTAVKNMKLVLKVVPTNDCALTGTDVICITDIQLSNGQPIGQLVWDGSQCATTSGTFTVYLLDTQSCTVNLDVYFTINDGPVQISQIKSANIPSGNTAGDCQPPT